MFYDNILSSQPDMFQTHFTEEQHFQFKLDTQVSNESPHLTNTVMSPDHIGGHLSELVPGKMSGSLIKICDFGVFFDKLDVMLKSWLDSCTVY